MKRLLVIGVFCTLVCVCLAPVPLCGQASATGTIAGLVTDRTGAIIVGANVTLTDTATTASKSVRTVPTNDAGRYLFPNINPGIYEIRVTAKGFRSFVFVAQQVIVGQTLTLDATLEVGIMTETVEVRMVAGAELQTTNATMGSTVTGDLLLNMPNLNRDATSLLMFQPATTPTVPYLGDVYGGQVAGSMSDQNTIMLDGGNITSDLEGDNNYTTWGTGQGAIPTPVESIQEFKVATNNQTADFASSGGAQVMLVSKRGADTFHGAAYEYFRSQVLDANTWDNNRFGNPIVKFHDNRFGGGVGGPMHPGKILGGKTYFYAFYEGRRYPGTASVLEWTVPSMLMRQGILQYKDASGVVHQVNLATSTVCGAAGNLPCDPRGIGIDPLVSELWNKYMPAPTDPTYGDTLNTQGFRAALTLPVKDDYGTGRIDHDFGDKWKLFLSYRVFRESAPTTDQIDIGGLLPGDKLGVPASVSSDPRHPSYWVAGLTGTLTPTLINEFHLSYLRNEWNWARQGVTDAISGVSAGIEFADSRYGCMCPVNMNTQQSRQRVWDGHDWTYSDTLSWVKGTHTMQFGGSVVHVWDHHVRDDQVVAGLPELVDQLNKGTGLVTGADYRPMDLPTSKHSIWDTQYAQTLGIIGTGAQLFVRGGSDFHLTGAKTFQDTSLIDSYSLYYNDSWHVRPSITINYGLEWGTQMPPYEINGVQDIVVDSSGVPISTQQFLQNTVSYALQGQVYNPVLGFEPIHAVAGHPKYPFNPYYGGFSPRVAVAWNPKFQSGILDRITGHGKTVIRGGYARLYDRNNGVDLVLTPLLGYGFGQTIRCGGAGIIDGVADCYGLSGTDPTNAFRLGVDGNTGPFPAVAQTLPIPAEPGINAAPGSNISFLDNSWRPGVNNTFSVSIQRELPSNIILEVAWVGKWSNHLFEGLDLNIVPYMMTLGGQTFAKAYAALWAADHAGSTTVAPQPFFENALKGSPYCAGYASCSAAVLAQEGANGTGNISTEYVTGLWSDLDTTWTAFGPALPGTTQGYNSMIGNTTGGWSNYQAGIVSVQKRTGQGLMLSGNFTWSHTLSTPIINQEYTQDSPNSPFDMHQDYGPAPFDTRFVLNMAGSYALPFGKGKRFATNNGILDRVIGGWSFSPIFTWNSGLPIETYTGSCGELGQGNVPWCAGVVPMASMSTYSRSAHYGVTSPYIGSNGNASSNGTGINMFADPTAVYNTLAPFVLGLDTKTNPSGPLYGQHRWNLDFSIVKSTPINERMGLTFYAQFFNALNHPQLADPGINLQDPANFGVISTQFNSPRQIELGLRFYF